jgi:hypothetical protein
MDDFEDKVAGRPLLCTVGGIMADDPYSEG